MTSRNDILLLMKDCGNLNRIRGVENKNRCIGFDLSPLLSILWARAALPGGLGLCGLSEKTSKSGSTTLYEMWENIRDKRRGILHGLHSGAQKL